MGAEVARHSLVGNLVGCARAVLLSISFNRTVIMIIIIIIIITTSSKSD